MSYESWGRIPEATHEVRRLRWRADGIPAGVPPGRPLLAYGCGRSYGDSCLCDGGTLLDARGLDGFIAFDPARARIRCEAGVTLSELLAFIVPRGFFLPVTPGTRYVTVGGAIANDVHGKNHHRAGTFGRHVRALELARSDGERLVCSPTERPDWFRASVGGLGLTGLILWAELDLLPIRSDRMALESIRFGGLDDFFALSEESDARSAYTVAWVDCLARGSALGRGLFMRADHAEGPPPAPSRPAKRPPAVPCDAPGWLLSRPTVRLFNALYYRKQLQDRVARVVPLEPFFYPLDAVGAWNRLYGRRGFFQYQCVVPTAGAREAMRAVLERLAASGQASFLAVLKVFGDVPSPGLLSFPRPGATLALDLPNRGSRTRELMDALDGLVLEAGGAVYPAKDARMAPETFAASYPCWRELLAYKDPRFTSGFWRRVTGGAQSG